MTVEEMQKTYAMILKPVFPALDLLETNNYLKRFSPGYGHIQAISHVDGLIRGGGLSSFYSSSAWALIWPAMQGAFDLGLVPLGNCLKSMIFHYHNAGRSKLKRVIPKDFFDGFSMDGSLKPDDMTGAYYDLYRKGRKVDGRWVPKDLFADILKKHPEKFAPPSFKVPPIPRAGLCSISKNVTLKNEPISMCIRFPVKDDKKSGWQFYGVTETVKSANNPENWITCPLGVAAIFEPRILDFHMEKGPQRIVFEIGEDGVFHRAV